MAANYLHGPETIEVENGARPVKTVKSAVIGLIGTAPMGDVNTLVQCLSEKDAAAFGSQFTGFTIPQALDAIYDHGAGTVLVINVLDPAKHKTAIEDEVVTFDKSTGQARLAHPVVANVVVKNSEGSTTHTANTDYRVDAQAGVLTNLGKAIEAGGSVKVSYEYADPSKVTAADIIGGVNSAGNRTGMKLLNDSFNLYGYFAKILIAPVFCTQKSVAVELIAMAEKLGFGQAIPLTDALHTAAGVLPEREALASSGAYANFCFGQGELLASPLQVAAMMNTIACGGICRTPLLLETTLDETTGTPLTALSHVRSRRVLTKRTAAALQALLAGVVAGGTGHEAALPGQTAAGKTGTAQTGQFSGGTELKNYWFAGFVPAEQPRYTIVVLQDTQAEPAFSSAAIFARVAAGLEILAP